MEFVNFTFKATIKVNPRLSFESNASDGNWLRFFILSKTEIEILYFFVALVRIVLRQN